MKWHPFEWFHIIAVTDSKSNLSVLKAVLISASDRNYLFYEGMTFDIHSDKVRDFY